MYNKSLYTISRINQVNIILFVLCSLLIKLGFGYLFVYVMRHGFSIEISAGASLFSSFGEEVLVTIFLAPIFESLLFQYLPFQYLSNKTRPLGVIVLSATLFGIVHSYNEMYQLYAFIAGLFYSMIYHIKGENFKAFLTITVIHMLFNSIVVLENNF